MAKDSKEAAQEHPGVPDAQWEGEHPDEEALAQEQAERESRLPENTPIAKDPAAEQEIGRAPGGPPADAAEVAAATAAAQAAAQQPEHAQARKQHRRS